VHASRAVAGIAAVIASGCFHPTPPEPFAAWSAGDPAPAPAAAAAPELPADGALDVDAAISYALAHAPVIGLRRDVDRVAEADIAAAGQLTNPELHLGRTTEDDRLLGDTTRFVIAFRLLLDRPWARDARIAAARASYRAERATTSAAERDVVAAIRRGYAELAFGDATRALLARQKDVLGERRRVLGEQLARSTATQLEVLLADQDAGEVDAQLSAIELAAARQRAELARLLGLPPGRAFHPVWDTAREHAIASGFDRRALEDRALARPELVELAARAEAAEAVVYEQRGRRVPWFESVQVERSVRDQAEWAVATTISLPLASLNTGGIAAADARRRRLVDERRRLGADTVRQVDDAIELAETTGRRARALRDRLAPLAEQLTALVAAETAAAVTDPVKLLLLEERHVRAARAVLDAERDHRMAVIALAALTGGAP